MGSANKIGSAFSGAGKMIAIGFGAVAVAGLAKIGTGFLMANANAEQLMTTMEIATGSIEKANAVYGEMQKMAASTPFELPELVQGAARIESFGQSSVDVMGMIGDTAAGTMKSIDQVTAAYLDAGMGQFVRLQELGIDAADMGETIRFKWNENGKAMVKEVDKNNGALIQSTVAAIWNAKYEGAMLKQSKTFNGQWSTLKDNFNLTMQDMTKGVFNFAKKGLGQANKFFDGFNKLRSKGVNPLRAAFMSLRGVLTPGSDVPTFWSRLTESIESFVFAVGRGIGIVKDFVVGLFDAFKAGKSVEALANRLPDSLQGIAAAVFGIADAFGDLWRGYQQGGFAELFSRLGEEAKQIASAGIDLAGIVVNVVSWALGKVPDIWEWFKGIIGVHGARLADPTANTGGGSNITSGDAAVTLSDVLVNIGSWAIGLIPDVWGWLKGIIGVHGARLADPTANTGGGSNITSGEAAVTLNNVMVDVASWAAGKIADLGAWIQDQLDGMPIIAAEIKEWKLILNGPTTVEAAPGAEAGTKEKISLLADAWKLTKIAVNYTAVATLEGFEVDARITDRLYGFLKRWADGLESIKVPFTNWTLNLLAWRDIRWDAGFGEQGGAIADGIKRLVNAISGVDVKFWNWKIDILSPSEIRWDAGLGDPAQRLWGWISGKVSAIDLPDVNLPSWNLSVPTPSLSFGGLLGALGGAGGAVWGWITEAVRGAIPDVSSGPWKLKLPSPSSIVNMSGGDVAANVGLWISTALTAAEAVTATLASWALKLAAPVIEGISDALAIVIWIEDKLDSFGESAASLLSWALDLPTPSINLSAGDLIGWITDKVGELYPDGIHIPINVIFDLNMPGLKSGGVLGDIKNAAQGGDNAMTFAATFTANIEAVERASNSVIMLGKSWGDSSFEGALEATKEGVEKAFAASKVMGGSWDISQFTADFLVDASGVSSAFNSATTIGNWWGDKVFTASFSVDTSGITNAVEVARQAAQAIADIMPHSPARKGPLREPISFAFIANDLIKHMGRMVPAAKSGIGSIAHYLGSLTTPAYGLAGSPIRSRASAGAYGGGGGRGDTYIFHNPIVGRGADQWVRRQVASGAGHLVAGVVVSHQIAGARR